MQAEMTILQLRQGPVCVVYRTPSLCYFSRKPNAKTLNLAPIRVFPDATHSLILAQLPHIDPWSPNIDSQSVASQLFAASLFPYLGFLYHLTKSKTSPKLTLFGFYFLLIFVAATIPAGIYAKLKYGTSLANVDWLHGGAESMLTLTNLFIVLGLRRAMREPNSADEASKEDSLETTQEEGMKLSK